MRVEDLLGDLKIAIELTDPKTLVDGCCCDPSVGFQCEGCFLYDVLRRSRFVIGIYHEAFTEWIKTKEKAIQEAE